MPNLRPPTDAERAAGLPTSKAEALEKGLTRFIHPDGSERIIRNYGSKNKPTGRVTPAHSRRTSQRKSNSRRAENEILSTPPELRTKENFSAADKKMSQARQQNKVGDHKYDVARVANGIKGLPNLQAVLNFFDAYKKAGIALGHQPDNIQPVDKYTNGSKKMRETAAVDNSIKRISGLPSLTDILTNNYSVGETHPMGGSLIETDSLGILNGPAIRIP